MEQLELTDPVTTPAVTTATFKVVGIAMHMETVAAVSGAPGLIVIELKDNLGVRRSQRYEGQTAIDYMKFINTANFSTKSLHKRILERLSSEGVLPGTVTGAPDA